MTSGKAFDDLLAERDALRAQVQRLESAMLTLSDNYMRARQRLQEQLLVETEQRQKAQDQRDRALRGCSALYKVERLEPDVDQPAAFVVRAESEDKARAVAAANCGDEGPREWIDPDCSTCELVEPDGPEGVILRDFWEA